MGINVEHRLDDRGLGHYSEGFRDDAPDFDLPSELGGADLADPCIGLEGRKRVLRVIATLAVDDGPGGRVQPTAAAGNHDFMSPFASPSPARGPSVP